VKVPKEKSKKVLSAERRTVEALRSLRRQRQPDPKRRKRNKNKKMQGSVASSTGEMAGDGGNNECESADKRSNDGAWASGDDGDDSESTDSESGDKETLGSKSRRAKYNTKHKKVTASTTKRTVRKTPSHPEVTGSKKPKGRRGLELPPGQVANNAIPSDIQPNTMYPDHLRWLPWSIGKKDYIL
jgi:hypothetical protein